MRDNAIKCLCQNFLSICDFNINLLSLSLSHLEKNRERLERLFVRERYTMRCREGVCVNVSLYKKSVIDTNQIDLALSISLSTRERERGRETNSKNPKENLEREREMYY